MSSFTEPLHLVYLPKQNKWKTTKAFDYHVGDEDSADYVHVPEKFISDLASVPYGFRWLIPKSGKYNQAAVLHDFLYMIMIYMYMNDVTELKDAFIGGVRVQNEKFRSRKECDDIFLEAMWVLGVSGWRRKAMHLAVRGFGGFNWRKKKSKYKLRTGPYSTVAKEN